ncbi:putative bifunctional diguanylate cyclase/phosphodiesterase [Actinoplanes sp. NPDC051343]|uniref:putative bifunctional diguanylate cyclase/phosphodiesterase n=1 Tax=Actinoplanes sp. NPDC051343 TaxID=3363906 RepID=UPI003798692B
MGRWAWRAFAGIGLLASVLYTLDLSVILSDACLLVTGIGTVWACFWGPSRHGARPSGAWRLIGVVALLFLVGVMVRPVVTDLEMPLPLIADAITIPAYALLCVFIAVLLRCRRSLDRHAVLDTLIVWMGGALFSFLILAEPAAAIHNRPAAESFMAGLYPLCDITVLLLMINLTFTARTWPVSLRAFLGALTFVAVGDTAYAIVGLQGQIYGSPLLNVPFLIGYTLMGVTALHPSAVELSRADRPPVQAWSVRRVALLVPALAVPFALLLVTGATMTHRWIIAVGGVLIVTALLVRAISAVRAQASAQRAAEHQARHDPLTGLLNRRAISAEIERRLARHEVWVFLLDLDGFKWVNDSWGHETGDRIVIEAGRRLRAAMPDSVPVARVGGDEFLLTYAGGKTDALSLADDIRRCFVRPFPVRDTEIPITASIGISHAVDDGGSAAMTAEALMRDADTAMYRAKAEGPGRSTIFDTSMHDEVRARIELEVALRQALADGQLYVAYQPIVRLSTGEPLGAEALVRWLHPQRGLVPPSVFIPVAESAGLIGTLGTWVRREALRQLGAWRTDGTVADEFYLSINVSAQQFSEPEMPLIVASELVEFGVPAGVVALEMTESVMVDGSSVTGRVLYELRELGVKLLIDDFGTGFSALGYLRRFPVTGVKIDRSFVTGLGADADDEEIVRAVVAMSTAMGLSVIAEGVETRLQRDALAAVGVTNGQGWLWGPAVPATEFAVHWHAGGTAALAGRSEPT